MDEEDELVMVTVDGSIKNFFYEECIQIVPEVDGTRVYTISDTIFLTPLHRLLF